MARTSLVCCLVTILLVNVVNGFAPSTALTAFRPAAAISETGLGLYRTVEAAIADAQMICSEQGHDSEACRVAWDIVEELEAEDSHRNSILNEGPVNNMTPDVDVMLFSFDILSNKIDGKMEQLKATAVKFHELGAADPSIEELYRQAEQMQAALRNVRSSFGRGG